MGTKYITLDEIQAFTKTVYSDTTEPSADTMDIWINNANTKINQDTGKDWGELTYTQKLKANKETGLFNSPVTKITTVLDSEGEAVEYEQPENNTSFITASADSVVTYKAGFTGMRISAKELARCYVLQNLVQSASTSSGNTEKIKVGPIEIVKKIAISSVVNLGSDIERYENDLRRLVR